MKNMGRCVYGVALFCRIIDAIRTGLILIDEYEALLGTSVLGGAFYCCKEIEKGI